jgi:hypothetical protein
MRQGLVAAFTAAVILAIAAPSYAANTQQDKMSACNQQATAKKLSGDALKTFMSSCMSASGTAANASSKAASCTSQADAKKLSGAARTSFVKKCEAG